MPSSYQFESGEWKLMTWPHHRVKYKEDKASYHMAAQNCNFRTSFIGENDLSVSSVLSPFEACRSQLHVNYQNIPSRCWVSFLPSRHRTNLFLVTLLGNNFAFPDVAASVGYSTRCGSCTYQPGGTGSPCPQETSRLTELSSVIGEKSCRTSFCLFSVLETARVRLGVWVSRLNFWWSRCALRCTATQGT